MYRTSDIHQISLFDFNQSFGTPLDADNEWVIYAGEIDWQAMETRYAALFADRKGRLAVPFRAVLGSLILQTRLGLSDRALIRAIAEDPYLQYFIGMDRYEHRAPFSAGSLPRMRRRFDREYLREINGMLPEELRLPEDIAGAQGSAAAEDDGVPAPAQDNDVPAFAQDDDVSAPAQDDDAQDGMQQRKVGLIFTTHGDQLVNEVVRCVRAELGDSVEITIRGDDAILNETVAAGEVTPRAASRLVRMYLDAMDEGCDAILNVCSSVGEVADAMREFAGITGVPIVRIDEEMCRRAVREDGRSEAAARPLHIAVMATLSSTLHPTRRLLQRCADEAGRRIDLIDVLVDNAFGLEPDALCTRLTEAAREHATDCDVIVLSQGSMSLCEEAIRQATGRPVYSSPRTGAWALRQALLRKTHPDG